jgi:hypothetical protein
MQEAPEGQAGAPGGNKRVPASETGGCQQGRQGGGGPRRVDRGSARTPRRVDRGAF